MRKATKIDLLYRGRTLDGSRAWNRVERASAVVPWSVFAGKNTTTGICLIYPCIKRRRILLGIFNFSAHYLEFKAELRLLITEICDSNHGG